jgi:hypothetical protein
MMLTKITAFSYDNKTKIINAELLMLTLRFFKYISYSVCVVDLHNLRRDFHSTNAKSNVH